MTVDEYAEILLERRLQFVHDGYYLNKEGQTGYRATYQRSSAYFWYSVSNSEAPIAPDEVARAITDPGRDIRRENRYFNRNLREGFEATVRAGDHSFMLSAAPDPRRV